MFRPLCLLVLCLGAVAARAGDPHPSLPLPVVPDCLGVNIHFTDPKPGELEMLAAAGFKWVRMDFGWGGTERKKGEYDFSAYDRLVAALDRFHLRAVFILDYGSPLYAEPGDTSPFTSRAHTPEFREAFGRWAVAAVQHFKGRGYLWEMWNEPNGGFWKSPDKTGDYIALAKSTGEALGQAGLLGPKGEAFIGPATSTIDLPYLEACFKAGLLDYWDAVSVHPYRQGAPETVEEEYRSVRLLIRQYAPKDKTIPIISGEWGYSSAWPGMGKDEATRTEQQGKYLPREFLTNIANDVALSIWYDWHDDGADPKEGEHRFGIVGNEYHAGRDPVYDPKPAYTAMKTLTNQLGGFRFNKKMAGGGKAELTLLFEREQQIRVACWNLRNLNYGMSDIARDDAQFDVFDSLGQKIPFVPGKIGSHNIFGDLRYVSPVEEADVKRFRFMAAFQRLPLEYVVHVPQNLTLEETVQNPLAGRLSFDMETDLPDLHGALEDLVLPDKTIPPRLTLEGHHSVTERKSFWVDDLQSRQPAVQIAYTNRGALESWGVRQEAPVIVSNSLAVEELNSSPDFLLLRVSNPSGEAFEGTMWLRFRDDRVGGAGYRDGLPVRMEAGQRELMIHVLIKECTGIAFDPGYDWQEMQREGQITLQDQRTRLPFQLRRTSALNFLQMSQAKTVADGDAKVESSVVASTAQPASGPSPMDAPSIKLNYRFAAGWKFTRFVLENSEKRSADFLSKTNGAKMPLKYAVWLYGDCKGCQTRIRFTDSTGQTFQSDGPKIDWKGWRYVAFPLMPTEDLPLAHWGGANDGQIHYPIKWDSLFLLDNVSRQPVEGEIYLSAPTLIY